MNLEAWENQWSNLVLKNQTSHRAEGDPAHDFLHLQRVVTLAKKLATEEKACLEIVIPAAWFHDWVNVPKNDPRRSQASQVSAEAVKKLLVEMKYPSHFIDAISHAIEAHSFSANIETQTLEAQIVQDADRLDALGAIGIARCFATASILGSSFYSAQDPFCQNREPDDRRYTVDHFFKKLLKIPDSLKTDAGRNEAKRRVEFMTTYLMEFGHELGTKES